MTAAPGAVAWVAPRRAAGGGRSVGRRVDRWLFAPGTTAQLVVVRTALAGLLALRIGLWPFAQLARQPRALFSPPPFLSWLAAMPPAGAIVALQVVGVTAAVVVIAQRRPRLGFALAWAAFAVLAGLKGSQGKILHNDVLLLLASAPFLLAPPVRWQRGPARPGRAWPVRAGWVVVAVAYGTAGLRKLQSSGLSWVTSDNFRWILYSAAAGPRSALPGLTRAMANQAWLCHLLAAGLLGFELLIPLALLFRPARSVAAVAAILLHGLTWLTLGLDYWAWAGVVAILFIPWDRWLEPCAGAEPSSQVVRGEAGQQVDVGGAGQ
jgi:hypothetical protein